MLGAIVFNDPATQVLLTGLRHDSAAHQDAEDQGGQSRHGMQQLILTSLQLA
jgi:hypothetical protein